ncbi:MAG: PepSY domain-containing protein, partial [Rubrivivax sp.]
HLQTVAPDARFWRIELPQRAEDALLLTWRAAQGNRQVAMHPATGELLPMPWGRKTEGGRHFMLFHYMLHGGIPGFWVVGWISMCALVALVSGVVVHRRIFADFFTFRPGKGQRSWLDAHNATAVLTLPFLFMIVYTGVAFFYTSYMPWPLQAAYGEQAYARYQKDLSHEAPPPARPRSGTPAALLPLAPLVQSAESLLQQPASMVVVEQPGDRSALVRVMASKEGRASSGTILNPTGTVAYDGVSGAVLQVKKSESPAAFSTEQIHGVVEALHLVHFGGWAMKWLYFVSGLLGTAMISTGTILFMVKRRKKSELEFGAGTAAVYRVVEALNVTAMAGICVASIAFFYANRLLPAALPGRELWEVRAFLGVWALMGIHALLRSPARAWVEQFGVAAVLCLALPLLNAVTTGEHLVAYAARGDGQSLGVELTAIGCGLLMGYMAWRVRRKWRVAA